MEKRKWVNKSDFVLIGILVIGAVGIFILYSFFMGKGQTNKAEILVDGEVVMTVSLIEDKVFTISEKSNVKFEIKDGAIKFLESDCPDKICVHTGFISKSGQMAVCLPNAVSVRTVSDNENEIDAVVG